MTIEKGNIIVIGAGGNAKVILSVITTLGLNIHGLLDDDRHKHGQYLLGAPILGNIRMIEQFPQCKGLISIGNNRIRRDIALDLEAVNWTTICHPWTHLGTEHAIGEGTAIYAGAVLQVDARIGKHCLINTSTTVEHDCVIEDFVHIAPGATLGGGARVGEGSLVGIGSTVLPGIDIGKWCTIGAGSVVIGNVPDNTTVVGVPAREVKNA